MKQQNDIEIKFAVLEYLPWLESPRVLFEFESLEEANKESLRLNSLIMSGSDFFVTRVPYKKEPK